MYKVILFDLDGTLTNPVIGITNGIMYALEKYNIKVKEKSELFKFIGPPLFYSFQMFYGFDEKQAKQGTEYYREYYSQKGLYENEVYEDIEDVLKYLKENGYTLGVATSKPEIFAIQILEHFQLSKYFNFIAGSSMDGTRLKKEDVIKYALDNLNVNDKSSVLMIGDTKYDVLGSKINGIDCLGVLYGYGNYDDLSKAKAKYIVEKPLNIIELIKKENEND